MTGTNCDLFTHKSSWSYLNHLVFSLSAFLVTKLEDGTSSHDSIHFCSWWVR
jgi:hypothetical protein